MSFHLQIFGVEFTLRKKFVTDLSLVLEMPVAQFAILCAIRVLHTTIKALILQGELDAESD
jgi:hypothetical protein